MALASYQDPGFAMHQGITADSLSKSVKKLFKSEIDLMFMLSNRKLEILITLTSV